MDRLPLSARRTNQNHRVQRHFSLYHRFNRYPSSLQCSTTPAPGHSSQRITIGSSQKDPSSQESPGWRIRVANPHDIPLPSILQWPHYHRYVVHLRRPLGGIENIPGPIEGVFAYTPKSLDVWVECLKDRWQNGIHWESICAGRFDYEVCAMARIRLDEATEVVRPTWRIE
jgi:hypothetical protein